jgi:zinc protease
MDQYVEHLSRITPEQVQAVARKYLIPDNLTVAILDPLPIAATASVQALPEGPAHVQQ